MYGVGGGAIAGVGGGAAALGGGGAVLPATGIAFGIYLATVLGLMTTGFVLQMLGRRGAQR